MVGRAGLQPRRFGVLTIISSFTDLTVRRPTDCEVRETRFKGEPLQRRS